jgi:hypothetical protein
MYSDCATLSYGVLHLNNCSFKINEKLIETGQRNVNGGARFCPITKRLQYDDRPNFNNCHFDWTSTDIRNDILDWKSFLLKNPDPFWYKASDFSPLDLDHPELDITIPMFVDRKSYMMQKVTIKSPRKTLFEGFMNNGNIKG